MSTFAQDIEEAAGNETIIAIGEVTSLRENPNGLRERSCRGPMRVNHWTTNTTMVTAHLNARQFTLGQKPK
jgi:hypothetical protein